MSNEKASIPNLTPKLHALGVRYPGAKIEGTDTLKSWGYIPKQEVRRVKMVYWLLP